MPDEEMTNVAVMHADTGVITAQVVRSEAISPHIQRVTIGGGDLDSFDYRGFDQWFRLLVPVHDQVRFDNVPSRFDIDSYQTFLTLPEETRPEVRNYTVRDFRRDGLELDIDFVVHGDAGRARRTTQLGARGAWTRDHRGSG
ncbi:MAG: siderophore-interacting protein [Cumulibacter sp.]